LYLAFSLILPATVSAFTHSPSSTRCPRRFRVNLDEGLAYIVAKARIIAVLLVDELQQAKRVNTSG